MRLISQRVQCSPLSPLLTFLQRFLRREVAGQSPATRGLKRGRDAAGGLLQRHLSASPEENSREEADCWCRRLARSLADLPGRQLKIVLDATVVAGLKQKRRADQRRPGVDSAAWLSSWPTGRPTWWSCFETEWIKIKGKEGKEKN